VEKKVNFVAGLPTWMWLTEANSGAGGSCTTKGKCPTVFVGAQGMAAR